MKDLQLDILKELINIGAGKAAHSLNQLFNSHIELAVPVVKWLAKPNPQEIYDEIAQWGFEELSTVRMGVAGSLSGNAQLVFSRDDANRLVNSLEEKHGLAPNEIGEEVFKEIGNILINGIIGTLGNLLEIKLTYRLPVYRKINMSGLMVVEKDASVIFCMIRFYIKEFQARGNFILTFEVEKIEPLVVILDQFLNRL